MQRLKQLKFGDAILVLPCFFPAVSSVKCNLAPSEYVQLLGAVEYPQFLFSAYDYENCGEVERRKLSDCLIAARQNNCTVLLDSGNYESFWREDAKWGADDFRRVCRTVKPNIAFCFDDQNPPADQAGAATAAISRIGADMRALPEQSVLPIVHGSTANLPLVVRDVVQKVRPKMVAVAERELGQGITERCRTLAAIRSQLNELEYYCPVHILGTGNPLSILAFVLSGADSFDGLEWCQTVADFSTGQLSHFQHWDLYASSSPLANAGDIPYLQKTLAHNLAFWAELMKEIRQFMGYNVQSTLINGILGRIRPILPGHIF